MKITDSQNFKSQMCQETYEHNCEEGQIYRIVVIIGKLMVTSFFVHITEIGIKLSSMDDLLRPKFTSALALQPTKSNERLRLESFLEPTLAEPGTLCLSFGHLLVRMCKLYHYNLYVKILQ